MKPSKRAATPTSVKRATSTSKPKSSAAKTRNTIKPRTIDKTWFLDQFAAKRISQRQLAFQIGMDPAALSLTLSGQRKMQIPEVEAMAANLGVPAAEVLRAAGLDMSAGAAKDALIVGWVDKGGMVHEGRLEGPRRVQTPADMPDGTQVLRIQGEAATDGWLVFYQPLNHIAADTAGRLCIINVQGGAFYLGKLRRGYSAGTWNVVHCFNLDILKEGAKVLSASPVQWIKTG